MEGQKPLRCHSKYYNLCLEDLPKGWNDMRVSTSWQNLNFWLHYPFNTQQQWVYIACVDPSYNGWYAPDFLYVFVCTTLTCMYVFARPCKNPLVASLMCEYDSGSVCIAVCDSKCVYCSLLHRSLHVDCAGAVAGLDLLA